LRTISILCRSPCQMSAGLSLPRRAKKLLQQNRLTLAFCREELATVTTIIHAVPCCRYCRWFSTSQLICPLFAAMVSAPQSLSLRDTGPLPEHPSSIILQASMAGRLLRVLLHNRVQLLSCPSRPASSLTFRLRRPSCKLPLFSAIATKVEQTEHERVKGP
jgi:hypothetical protein